MLPRRILISAGGTGGHLYPAQSLAQELRRHLPSSEVLFIGGGLGTTPFFDRQAFAFREIASGSVSFGNPVKCLRGIGRICKGYKESKRILREFRPDVAVGFGSYYAVPPLLAARRLKIPFILHEANTVPGIANRWLAPIAHSIALNFSSARTFFKGKCVDVGLPLREGYCLSSELRIQAGDYYGFKDPGTTLLISGGSQGAQGINALCAEIASLFARLSLRVIHLTGNPEAASEIRALYASFGIQAVVKPFENRMEMAWSIADFFIGRSGASTIAESIEFEVPGILIPYPYAVYDHQEKNADFFAATIRGGVKQSQFPSDAEKLASLVEAFTEPNKRNLFKEGLAAYKLRPERVPLWQLIASVHAEQSGVRHGR